MPKKFSDTRLTENVQKGTSLQRLHCAITVNRTSQSSKNVSDCVSLKHHKALEYHTLSDTKLPVGDTAENTFYFLLNIGNDNANSYHRKMAFCDTHSLILVFQMHLSSNPSVCNLSRCYYALLKIMHLFSLYGI